MTTQDRAAEKGLHAEVRAAAREVLLIAAETIKRTALKDTRRVQRRTDKNSSTIFLQNYFGVLSASAVTARLAEAKVPELLIPPLTEFHPDFQAIEFGNERYPIDASVLLRWWSTELARRIARTDLPFSSIVDQFLDEFDALLRERTLERRTVVSLLGLDLVGIERIEIDDGIVLRKMSFDEEAELFANDIWQAPRLPDGEHLDAVLEISRQQAFSIVGADKHAGEAASAISMYDEPRVVSKALILALHVLNAGSISVLEIEPSFLPALLPYTGSKGRTYSLETYRHESQALRAQDVTSLINVYKEFRRLGDDARLSRAARRLTDASRRFDSSDATVDCVIGLEALLGQGTLLVSLNYAAIGAQTERRERAEQAKEVMGARHLIVHAGENATEEVLAKSKSCLRDALQKFLLKKVAWRSDPDYWKQLLN